VYALDLETGRASRVYEAPAAWWIDEENIALPRRDGSVVVSRFNRSELAITGEPALLVSDVRLSSGGGGFSASGEGTLLYVSGPPYTVTGGGDLVEIGPDGETSLLESEILPDFDNGGLSISPDGTYLAVTRLADNDSEPDIWVKELPDGAFRQLTDSDSADYRPQWSPDGRYVTFISDREGSPAFYRRRVDGGVPAELVHAVSDGAVREAVISPDGEWLAAEVDQRIRVYRTGSDEPTDVIAERARWFTISPDGRWIAYTGDRGGTPQVYVRPFPNVSQGDLVQVSIDGGVQPFWNRDADELFFRYEGNVSLARVSYTADSVFRPGPPEPFLNVAGFIGVNGYFWLAALPGGTRFLTIAPEGGRLSEFGQPVLERNSWTEAGARAGGR